MDIAPVQELFSACEIERFEVYERLPLVEGAVFRAFTLGSCAVGGNHAHVEDAGVLGDRAAHLVAHPLVALEHGVGYLAAPFAEHARCCDVHAFIR